MVCVVPDSLQEPEHESEQMPHNFTARQEEEVPPYMDVDISPLIQETKLYVFIRKIQTLSIVNDITIVTFTYNIILYTIIYFQPPGEKYVRFSRMQ